MALVITRSLARLQGEQAWPRIADDLVRARQPAARGGHAGPQVRGTRLVGRPELQAARRRESDLRPHPFGTVQCRIGRPPNA